VIMRYARLKNTLTTVIQLEVIPRTIENERVLNRLSNEIDTQLFCRKRSGLLINSSVLSRYFLFVDGMILKMLSKDSKAPELRMILYKSNVVKWSIYVLSALALSVVARALGYSSEAQLCIIIFVGIAPYIVFSLLIYNGKVDTIQ
jgi:hypothetical protein